MKETKTPASSIPAALVKNKGGVALAPPVQAISAAAPPVIQTKLLVGHPNDPLEHEADRAADRVVSLWQDGGFSSAPAGEGPPAKPIAPIIQRRAASPASGSVEASPQVTQQIQAAQGSGQALPGELLPPLEATFGMNFSGVRLHTDHRADALNRDLQARAFTTGQDIFFRQGEYRPGTAEGVRLLGHELGHVGQQGGGIIRRQEADTSAPVEEERPSQESSARPRTTRGAAPARSRSGSSRTLEITSETFNTAPSGAPNTRRIIGVGEYVQFRTNRTVHWEMTEQSPRQRPTAEMFVTWERPGIKTIIVRTQGEENRLQMTVVPPSLRTRKIREIAVEDPEFPGGVLPGAVGVLMQLEFQLTPLEVSFSTISFHEEVCPAVDIWGYFAEHRELAHAHDPRPQHPGRIYPEWVAIDRRNIAQSPDHCAYWFRPQDRPWPLLPGGFSWHIPGTYQINGNRYPMQLPMIQTFRIEPRPDNPRPPFIGSITAWKGGQMVTRSYV